MIASKSLEQPRKRVVIVDDSRSTQAFLEQIFAAHSGYDVVGCAGDAKSGLSMIHRLQPDLVTIGLQMPYIDGRPILAIPNICKVVISDRVAGNPAVKDRLETLGAHACMRTSDIAGDTETFCASLLSLISTIAEMAMVERAEARLDSNAGVAVLRTQPAAAAYPIPRDERERLAAIATLHLANDDADHQLDLLTTHLGKATGFSACAMTFIDRDTQWTKSAYGIGRGSAARAQAVCSYTICGTEPFIVEDLQADRRFCNMDGVVAEPRIRSYVGYPIVGASGVTLGTVCLLDTEPRRVTVSELMNLRSTARIAAELIESRGVVAIQRAA